jgi:putative transposase
LALRRQIKDVLHLLAIQKDCKIEEGYLMKDHVHMLISIPPKYSVSSIFGFIKGKSSIWIAQNIDNKKQNFGLAGWAHYSYQDFIFLH